MEGAPCHKSEAQWGQDLETVPATDTAQFTAAQNTSFPGSPRKPEQGDKGRVSGRTDRSRGQNPVQLPSRRASRTGPSEKAVRRREGSQGEPSQALGVREGLWSFCLQQVSADGPVGTHPLPFCRNRRERGCGGTRQVGGLGTEERPRAWPRGRRRRRYLQAVQEELHAVEAEEHLAVVRRLVRDVPQRAPGELHDLVALQAGGVSAGSPGQALGLPAPSEGSPDQTPATPGHTGPLWGRTEWFHGDATYYFVQQLLLNQLQHGLRAEEGTCGGRRALQAPVPPTSPPGVMAILFLTRTTGPSAWEAV